MAKLSLGEHSFVFRGNVYHGDVDVEDPEVLSALITKYKEVAGADPAMEGSVTAVTEDTAESEDPQTPANPESEEDKSNSESDTEPNPEQGSEEGAENADANAETGSESENSKKRR